MADQGPPQCYSKRGIGGGGVKSYQTCIHGTLEGGIMVGTLALGAPRCWGGKEHIIAAVAPISHRCIHMMSHQVRRSCYNNAFILKSRGTEDTRAPPVCHIWNMGLAAHVLYIQYIPPTNSVADPWHFGVDPDPDPRIHASDKWIRILLFSSLTFKMPAKI
jgi:hypothetical protein